MKDNYWFPAKRYGRGWGMPRKWQGWAVLIVWILVLFAGMAAIGSDQLAHVAFMLIMVAILLLICYLKGEPLKWRWGK
jgi:uncharacterized membrane protein YhaH (DUF805 family)